MRTKATLNLLSSAGMNWSSGFLIDLTVNAESGAVITIPADPGGPGPVMSATDINIQSKSTLQWNSQSVSVTPGVVNRQSSISINQGGLFNIDVTGGSWGDKADNSLFAVSNSGTVQVNGSAKLYGSYTTWATTNVPGSIEIDGAAEQGGGTFTIGSNTNGTIKDGSVTVKNGAGTPIVDVLGIRAGILLGSGTINGNVNIGNDPKAPGFGRLPPEIKANKL